MYGKAIPPQLFPVRHACRHVYHSALVRSSSGVALPGLQGDATLAELAHVLGDDLVVRKIPHEGMLRVAQAKVEAPATQGVSIA